MKIEILIPDADPLKGECDRALTADNLPLGMSRTELIRIFGEIAHLKLLHLSDTCAFICTATASDGQRLLAATISINGNIVRISRTPPW